MCVPVLKSEQFSPGCGALLHRRPMGGYGQTPASHESSHSMPLSVFHRNGFWHASMASEHSTNATRFMANQPYGRAPGAGRA